MAVAVALAGGGLAIWNTQRGNAVIYITAPVERGAIQRTITASGSERDGASQSG